MRSFGDCKIRLLQLLRKLLWKKQHHYHNNNNNNKSLVFSFSQKKLEMDAFENNNKNINNNKNNNNNNNNTTNSKPISNIELVATHLFNNNNNNNKARTKDALTITNKNKNTKTNNNNTMCRPPYMTTNNENNNNNNNEELVWRRMRNLTFVAAIGGFLFGYDTGVVSGAMLPMRRAFDLTSLQQEVIVSSTVLAAFASSLFLGAPLNDRFGRKYTILASAGVFGIGSGILFLANGYAMLVIGRIILGLGIGVASLTTPIYIAEVALPKLRGRLVTVNTLLITFGQFFAGMVDGYFDSKFPETGWRYMLGLAVVPSAIMFVGFLKLPESPRWLANKGRWKEARDVLENYRVTKEEAEAELEEIAGSSSKMKNHKNNNNNNNNNNKEDSEELYNERSNLSLASDDDSSNYGSDGSSFSSSNTSTSCSPRAQNNPITGSSTRRTNTKRTTTTIATSAFGPWMAMLADPPTRRALVLGCGLMAVQQFSGINTVMYYAASIYEMAGYDELTAVWLSGFTALAQVVGIATSIFLVDKVGRRTLVLVSLGFVTVSLMGLALSFYWSRISSGEVVFVDDSSSSSSGSGGSHWNTSSLYDPEKCIHQQAMIWDGIVAYCYDCSKIPGCGYCGNDVGGILEGSCVPGNEAGPFTSTSSSTTATTSSARNSYCEVWDYDTCSSGSDTSTTTTTTTTNPYGILSVLFMVLYLLAFGIGMGGMPWTINSEIYKLEYRSMAVSLSTATNWIGNLVVSATFLTLSSPGVLTAYGAFGLYGGVALLGWAWLVWALPETKGLGLEEIEGLFRRPWDNDHYYGDTDDEEGRMLLETRDLDELELRGKSVI